MPWGSGRAAVAPLIVWWRRRRAPQLVAADSARDRKRFSEAADLYAKAIAAHPTRTDLRVQRANMLKDCGRYEEAEEEYLIAAVSRPRDPDVQLQLGHLYKAMGDRAKAMDHYRHAGALARGKTEAYAELRRMGDEGALEAGFHAAVSAGGVEALLSMADETRRLRLAAEAMSRALPSLAAEAAFPIQHYDTLRQIWDPPAPPEGSIRPISVLIHMDGQSYAALNSMAAALSAQAVPEFEVLLCGADQSRRDWALRVAISDPRFVVSDEVRGIVDLAARARHDLIVLPRPGAIFHRQALAWFGWAAGQTGASAFICDEERLERFGEANVRRHPDLRQIVDHEALSQFNPYGETLAFDRARLAELDPPSSAPWADVAFQLLLEMSADGLVGHVPFPLVAMESASEPTHDPTSRARIVRDHLAGRGWGNQVDVGPAAEPQNGLRVRWKSGDASIAVLIPTRDNGADVTALVGSLRRLAAQPQRLSIIVVDNGSVDPESLRQLGELGRQGVVMLRSDEPFNWSRLSNTAAAHADDELVLFMNDDMLMLTAGWDDLARALLARPDVGVVGAKLLYPDHTIQHAGILFGWQGRAIHDGLHEARDAPGPGKRWQLRRRVSAVTGAFMAMRRSLFAEVGGFDATNLAISYSDLDLCLKVRSLGRSVLYEPAIEMIHYESKTRGLTHLNESTAAVDEAELSVMRARWPGVLDYDPSVHPAWRAATLPFRLLSPPSDASVRRHLLATAALDGWLPKHADGV